MSGKGKCSWAAMNNGSNAKILSFDSIMNEQMQVKIQLEEDIKLNNDEEEAKRLHNLINGEVDSTADDLELAKLLQDQFDKEELNYLENVKEAGLNVKLEKQLSKLESDELDPKDQTSDDDSSEDETFKREWDSFEKAQGPLSKYEKHDLTVSGRKNACRALNMNISTGDIGCPNHDLKLNNNVYNSLKTHVKKERKRFARLNEAKLKSTAEGVMDEKSRLVLFKLINAEILDEINGIISTGKEANVYHGVGSNFEKEIDLGEVAIKIFKTSLNEFKNRSSYIRNDYRFNDRLSKQNSHKTIQLWAEKEMNNLNRIRKAGILCPNVVMLKKHILVMEFLGHDGKASPTLREVNLTYTQLERARVEVVEIMKDMYSKCDLVHADLSEYNLMYHKGRVYVLDVGQSVLKGHPFSHQFLLRDCKNVSRFFLSRGIADMCSGSELFCEITGINKANLNYDDDVEILQKISEIERDQAFFSKDVSKPEKSAEVFEEMFNKSMTERDLNNLENDKTDKVSIKNSCIE